MARCAKPSWQHRFQLTNTPFQLKKLAAAIAAEMMVVSLACRLVACRIAGNFDGLKPFLLDQVLNVSINSGDSEASMTPLRALQCFVWRQRPICFEERFADRSFLFRIACVHQAIIENKLSLVYKFSDGSVRNGVARWKERSAALV
jgi:hypothetical protein